MSELVVTNTRTTQWDPRVVLGFGAIYLFWGGTFLAIRVAVLQIPPCFTAGVRFVVAGSILYAVMRLRGQARPSWLEWRNLALVSFCMFVATYGPLFWAERYVTSSMTAIIEATLPLTAIILEVFVFRTQILQWRVLVGVITGFVGVALLMFHNDQQQLARVPTLVILAAGVAWSLGAVLSGRLKLHPSRVLTAGAEMTIAGVVLLAWSAVSGELNPLPRITLSAALALLYLIVFGSLIAFTAYVWLLARFSVTRVSSHAYVNPIIALGLGYFAAGEIITVRSVIAAVLVVGSVLLILARDPDPRMR
jgi:drug/metabolite transporter (DMT)-like permease